jgi:hypothetical protein
VSRVVFIAKNSVVRVGVFGLGYVAKQSGI